jgi:hypothetical protein
MAEGSATVAILPPMHRAVAQALQRRDAALLNGTVRVDYETLNPFARLVRGTMAILADAHDRLTQAETLGFDLEKQCGKPLIRLDVTPQQTPTASTPDSWEDPDALTARIARYVADKPRVTTTQIIEGIGETPTQSLQIRVGCALRRMGYGRKRQSTTGDRQRYYERLPLRLAGKTRPA